MKTPIVDFVRKYAESGNIRAHMPGHKGKPFLGYEPFDITEIDGADSLYEADGIIAESEKNAGRLFGAKTFYSAEGSSLAIRSMLYLAVKYAAVSGKKPLVLAGRNAHKSFFGAAALLDFEIEWIYPENGGSYLSCPITAKDAEPLLEREPCAVYLTSPDYLGNTVDIKGIADLCKKKGVLLIVDNAHGAYLKFLEKSAHPIDLGADMCADSAHKTLPVITGGAYMHISPSAPAFLADNAREALSLFGSTSPSYLILQSLDAANARLAGSFKQELSVAAQRVERLKERALSLGLSLTGDEPLKIGIMPKSFGYTGFEFAEIFKENGVICEFCDPDFVVLMFSADNSEEDFSTVRNALESIKKRAPVTEAPPCGLRPKRITGIRKAVMSPSETVPTESATGRVLSFSSVGCPPAVPIVCAGEEIDGAAVAAFRYYGINTLRVMK